MIQANSNRDFREVIELLAGTHRRDWVNVVVAQVKSVNIDTMTCSIIPISGDASINSDIQIDGIQLNAEQNDGFLLLPTVDSTVIVVYPTKTNPFVVMYSAIDAIMAVTEPGQQLLLGKYYDSQQDKVVDGEIQAIASTGEKVIIGKPATSNGGILADSGNGATVELTNKVKINTGSSKAVLGDKNITALTDVYNMLTAVQTFASAASASLDPATAAAATALNISLNAMLPGYNTDINNTTSNNVTLD